MMTSATATTATDVVAIASAAEAEAEATSEQAVLADSCTGTGQDHRCLYLYQISSDDKCQSILGGKPVNPASQSHHNYGILFAEDGSCDDFLSPIDVMFPIGGDDDDDDDDDNNNDQVNINNNNNKIGEISFIKRTEVQFHLDPSGSCELLDKLIKLNILLDDGATYGRSKKCRTRQSGSGSGSKSDADADADADAFKHYDRFVAQARDEMKTSMSKRTYMLVPILDQHPHQADGGEEEDENIDSSCSVQIDWTLVERIIQNQLVPYMEWEGRNDDNQRGFVFQPTSTALYSLHCQQHCTINESVLDDKIVTLQSRMNGGSDEYKSYEEYYAGKYGIEVEHPELPLVPVRKVMSMKCEFEIGCGRADREGEGGEIMHLVPELMVVFPMPWEMMMMHRLIRFIAPRTEKEIVSATATFSIASMISERFLLTYACGGVEEVHANCNPLSTLGYKYNNAGYKIKTFLADYFVSVKGRKWWRSVLSCPITNRQFCSSIARQCVKGGDDVARSGYVDFRKRIYGYFGVEGEDYIITDGVLFFISKKMAHQTAALTALEHILIRDGVIEYIDISTNANEATSSCLVATFDNEANNGIITNPLGPSPTIVSSTTIDANSITMTSQQFLLTYATCECNNPLSALARKYQMAGISSSCKSFLTDYRYGEDGHSFWWRSVLACPITNRQFCSSIARQCMKEGDGVGDAEKVICDFFGVEGENYMMKDGFLFYKSKKMAHQTAALAALEYILTNDGVIEHVHADATANANGATSSSCLVAICDSILQIQIKQGQKEEHPKDCDNEKSDNENNGAAQVPFGLFPGFIHKLYNMGVRSSGLHVEFMTDRPATKEKYLSRTFLGDQDPTRLMCNICIQFPTKQEVSSDQSSSIEKAFCSAVEQLENILGLPYDQDSKDSTSTDTTTYQEAMKEMHEIYKIYKNKASYVQSHSHPPSFAIRDVYPNSAHVHNSHANTSQDHRCLHLYQISSDDKCQSILGGKPANPASQNHHNYGILFAEDVSCDFHSPIDFSFPIDRASHKVGNISLIKRTEVQFHLDPSGSCELLDKLIKLNIILDDGESYGRSKKCRTRQSGSGSESDAFKHYDRFVAQARDEMKTSLSKRTYMLVPILDQHPHQIPTTAAAPSASSGEEENIDSSCSVQIDWTLVERIIQNQLVPYMEWEGRNDDNQRGFVFQPTSTELYSLHCQQHGTINESVLNEIVTLQSRMNGGSDKYKSYEEYYVGKYGIKVEHPELPLVPVRKVISTKREFEIGCGRADREIFYLVPELMVVFPMSWEMMMMHKLFLSFVMPMERVIQLRFTVRQLINTPSRFRNDFGNLALEEIPPCKNMDSTTLSSYLHFLEEATSSRPCAAYERLEHLGDAVLGYISALNHFAHNHTLEWDNEDLGEHKLATTTNKVLAKAALKVGLDRIIVTPAAFKKWETCYKGTVNSRNIVDSSSICYSELADFMEGVLAVPFISESKSNGSAYFCTKEAEEIIIGIFERAKLPMKEIYKNNNELGSRWFLPQSACFNDGYNFSHQPEWEKQMESIRKLLHYDVYVDTKLMEGFDGLCCLFQRLNSCADFDFNEASKLLVKISLFDDSLDSDDDESLSGCNHLEKVAMFRQNLFFLGDSTLHLTLTTECFKRNPSASAGDLHLLLACCIMDDTLAYLMIKHGIHHFLIDQAADEFNELPNYIKVADEKGLENWNINGGWTLGLEEFRNRWASRWWSEKGPRSYDDQNRTVPTYPGLCGGLLYGRKKRLDGNLTIDLAYSFKCIVGALTLSNGVQRMWELMVPLFEELLLMNPDEIRKNHESYITSTYSKGKKGSSTRKAQEHQSLYNHGWSAILR